MTYLQQIMDFDGILSTDSRVCKPCYDFHQLVLQQQNASQPTPDSTLHDIEYQLEREIVKNNKVITDKEYLGCIVCKVALQLVKIFQQDGPILLPEVHVDFCRLVSESTEQFPNVQKSLQTNPPSKQWLLSSLKSSLKKTLPSCAIVCSLKKTLPSLSSLKKTLPLCANTKGRPFVFAHYGKVHFFTESIFKTSWECT